MKYRDLLEDLKSAQNIRDFITDPNRQNSTEKHDFTTRADAALASPNVTGFTKGQKNSQPDITE